MRTFRVVSMAALVAVVAFVYAMRRGTPAPFVQMSAIGADSIDARGGVVLDLMLHAPDARAHDAALGVIERRLARFGAVSRNGDRITVLDVDADRAAGVRAAASLGGRLEMRVVAEDTDELSIAIGEKHDLLGRFEPTVSVDSDMWTAEDSNVRHNAPFLVSRDLAALRRVIGTLPGGGEGRVVLELVTPESSARDRLPYWRTYVVAAETWILNDDLERAGAAWDPNTDKPIVQVEFTDAGARRFGDLTSAHVGDKIAILIDGVVDSAPIINGPIRGGHAVITMGGSDPDHMQNEADALVSTLRDGTIIPFAVDVHVAREREPNVVRLALGRALFALACALLALALAWPLVRWPALRRAPVSAGRPALPSRWGALAPRGLVTIGVLAALIGLAHVAAPGINREALPGGIHVSVSIVALGATPIVVAYLLVALCASFAPAWSARPSRTGVTVALAAALALIEAWFHASHLSGIVLDDALVPPDARWEVAIALCGGVALYALGAAAIDRWGLGRGWGAVLALDVARKLSDDAAHVPSTTWLFAAAIATVAIIAARTRVGGGGPARAVRLPIAAFVGATAVPLILDFAWLPLQDLRLPLPAYTVLLALQGPRLAIAIAASLTALLAWFGSRRLAGADRARAIGLDVAIAIALAGLPFGLGIQPWFTVEAIIAAAALADIAAEARARARGAWSPIAEVHDVGAADDLLDGAAAPRLARGLHVRALLRGLGPMVPIEVIEAQSPEQQAAEAQLAPARLVAE